MCWSKFELESRFKAYLLFGSMRLSSSYKRVLCVYLEIGFFILEINVAWKISLGRLKFRETRRKFGTWKFEQIINYNSGWKLDWKWIQFVFYFIFGIARFWHAIFQLPIIRSSVLVVISLFKSLLKINNFPYKLMPRRKVIISFYDKIKYFNYSTNIEIPSFQS